MGFFSDLFGGGDSGPTPAEQKATELQNQINEITLARLQRENKEVLKAEAERQSILESGRRGRKSLFTRGFLGPGSTPGQIFRPRFSAPLVATRGADRTVPNPIGASVGALFPDRVGRRFANQTRTIPGEVTGVRRT